MSNATIKNTATCAILIPHAGADLEGLIAPGDTIEVSEKSLGTDFVKNLIEIGELELVGSSIQIVKSDDDEDEEGEELELLRTEAEELGINVDKRWGINRLKEEIAKA